MPAKRTFCKAVQNSDFTVTAQLCLDQNSSRQDIIDQARILSPLVDAITVPANPDGIIHIAGLALASILIEHGIDPLFTICTRDRNVVALRSELLGAAALGVTSLVVQRGEKLRKDFRPKTREVFEFGAKKLLATASQLNEFRTTHAEPALLLGALATVFQPEPTWAPTELSAKADAGAMFFLTKACCDPDMLRDYMAALVTARITHRCHIVVSVPIVTSAAAANALNQRAKTPFVTQQVVAQLEQSQNAAQLGVEIAAAFVRELHDIPGVGGVNLVTTENADAIPAVLELTMSHRSRPPH